MSYFEEVLAKAADSPSIDAFGRWRTSGLTTLFDSKQIFDNQPLLWDETTLTDTTSAHSTDTASTVITYDGGATGGTFTRQTFQRFNYQPGKSQLILMTGILDRSGGGTGITRRVGYFDDDNGLFFEDDQGTVKVVRRTNVTGTPVDNEVAQSSWNLDVMNGTGASGIAIDWTKVQIFLIDFEWLGVGRARMGLVVDGVIYYVHQFLAANTLDKVYMSTPNLPLRYQLVAVGGSAASTMEAVCASVISEGGADSRGVLRHKSTAGTPVDCAVVDTLYAVVTLRLKTTHLGETVDIVRCSMQLQSASDDVEWILIFDPTIAGSPSFTAMTNSAIEYNLGATANTVTGGTHVDAGYLSTGSGQSSSSSSGQEVPNALHLGAAIDGTRQTVALCCRSLTAINAIVEGGITWREKT